MKYLAVCVIALYRACSLYIPAQCKFYPSCSHYAQEAFTKYTFCKALYLTLKRIVRCNPFTAGGVDALP